MNLKELNHALATGCPVVQANAKLGTVRYAYVSQIIKRRGSTPGSFVFSAQVTDHGRNSVTVCDPAELSFFDPTDLPEEAQAEELGLFRNVRLTNGEHEALVARYGPRTAEELINNLSMKMRSKGYRFADHYATILSWAARDGIREVDEKSYDLEGFWQAAVHRADQEPAE